MMTTAEKLTALRRAMARRGLAAYLVLTDDFHASEYVGDYFKAREYLSGFTGSAGTLLILPSRALLWTDGRYFLQAESQLAGSGIELMRSGEPDVPTLERFLLAELEDGSLLGFDARTVNTALARRLGNKLRTKHIRFAGDEDLVGALWPDRPPLSAAPVWELGIDYAGEARADKLARVRAAMADEGADAFVVTALDELAWLLDLRGNDVACTPVFLGFLLLTKENAVLCARAGAVGEEVKASLAADGVRLADYEGIYGLVRALPRGTRVLLDGATANYRLTQSVPDGAETLDRPSPIVPMKAVKNAVEQENLRRAHLADGIALTRFLRWLKCDAVREGATELSAAAKLEEYRRESADYLEPSFDPILAYGPHGAIIHYEATEETDVPLEAHGLLLADTGGHYRTGTTDVTRTVALGPVAEEEKRACTLVLRGHLALAAARFRAGVTGENLDILARGPLWDEGLDYNHGTGHGVGYLLSVHEGPQRIHWSIASNARHTALEPGMIFSDEPGLYLAGKFGVRLENLLLVREAETNAYGRFLSLEPLTLAPFDRDTIDPSLLSDRELAQLNAYHARGSELAICAVSAIMAQTTITEKEKNGMDIFDILGPVMVGPSSSHTAGAARIGAMARTLLGGEVAYAKLHLYGSFAETGKGHGTDRALVAGLLGMKPDDLRIPNAFEEAKKAGLRYTIDEIDLRDAHPNTAVLELTGKGGRTLTVQASSLGGGRIMVNKLDGIEVNFTGESNTLVVRNQDEFGSVAAVTSILNQLRVNVANMSVHRHKRGGDALMVIETDQHIKPKQVEFISELPGILGVTYYDKEDDEDGSGFDERNL